MSSCVAEAGTRHAGSADAQAQNRCGKVHQHPSLVALRCGKTWPGADDKKHFAQDGLEAAPEPRQRETPPRAITSDGEFEARLIALACTEAPKGHARRTVRLPADKAGELDFAPSLSHMTAQRVLKNTLSLAGTDIGKFHRGKTRLSWPQWRMCCRLP